MALLSAAALFRQTAGLGLMGHDTYPLIVTTRIASWSAALSNLTQRLMDGRYPDAFYRPLPGLTIALDHALWGLTPLGYQLTSVLVLAACVVALGELAWRLCGRASWVVPLVTALVFAAHPRLFEVLPVPSRRAELLCCLFMILAVSTQLSPRRLASPRPGLWPAVFTLLAIASKETAFLLPALVFVALLAASPRAGWARRCGHALTASVPHLAAAAALLAARLAVLGGLGGHESTSPGQLLGNLPNAFLAIAGGVALPAAPLLGPAGPRLAAALLLFAAAALLIHAWGRPEAAPPDALDAQAMGPALVALAWLALVISVHALAGLVSSWHVLIPVAGWALLSGIGVWYFARLARQASGIAARATAAVSWLLLVVLLSWQARFSPIVFHYDEWERGSAASKQFLEQTKIVIEGTADGQVAIAPPLPYWVLPKSQGATVDGAAVLADYSVQAWADLIFSERKVRVSYGYQDGRSPAADELFLRIPTKREDL